MNVIKYLKSRLADICLYTFIVLLAYTILCLDNNINPSNRDYLVLLMVIIGIAYLLIDYAIKRSRIQGLKEINTENVIQKLPIPTNEVEEIYQQLIKNISTSHQTAILQIEKNNIDEIELLTLLAHRLKTPLTTMSLLAENIEEQSKQKINEELFRLSEDVNKMLFYARSNDFSNDYVISDVRIKKVINASVKKHSTMFIAKSIAIEISILEDNVLSDEKWLSFIIDQLISNAVKYTRTKGCIKISAYSLDNAAIIEVKDNGIGIKIQDISRVFNRSFTGENGRKDLTATGMGLYLANKLANKLGHKLSIKSKENEGTQVSIQINKYLDDMAPKPM